MNPRIQEWSSDRGARVPSTTLRNFSCKFLQQPLAAASNLEWSIAAASNLEWSIAAAKHCIQQAEYSLPSCTN